MKRTGDRDWTDLNVSDPGIPLLDLFAFLAEELVSPRRRRSLLALAAVLAFVCWRRRTE